MAQNQVQAAGESQHKAPVKNTRKAVSKGKAVSKSKAPGKGVAVHQPVAPPATLDQQILLAAADPRVDVEKMKALTDLRRQMRMEAAEEEFNLALAAAQQEMRPVEADANNPQTHSKYATLYGVDKALRPIYSKHGFSISFNTTDCPLADHIRVVCYVSRGLYTRPYQYDVAVDPKGPKGNDVMTKTHAGGSALSYGKRYTLLMIFNVTIRRGIDRDDDGNAAAGIKPITKAQLDELVKLADAAGADKRKFCELMAVDSLADIPSNLFPAAKKQLQAKLKQAQAKKSDFPGDNPL